jgi:3-carboxy-cis,cis-muconate cycloisomerase
MPASIIDSAIFQGIFSSEEMRHIWSDENRTQKYLDVEAALAKVQGRLGLIPREAADEIISHCRLDQIDMAKLRQQTERIGYPILGVVSQLNALCRNKLGEYCHWGATTQDITDTATVLQIREALAIVDRDLAAISSAMAQLAKKHRDTPMIGRSNLQQAIPVTFGYKMAGLLSAIEPSATRWPACSRRSSGIASGSRNSRNVSWSVNSQELPGPSRRWSAAPWKRRPACARSSG